VLYLGYYVLGWGLRGVVLRGVLLTAACALLLVTALLTMWQWRNPAAPDWLQALSPANYYGLTVHLFSVLVFLVAQAMIRPGGLLSFLANGRPAKIGATLGASTLGVFGLHLLVVDRSLRLPLVGGERVATSALQIGGRVVAVLAVTYAVVLVLRRIPAFRRIL
jgi:surface polysaccharide O-acyltransferase-like enzyme